MMNPNQKKSAVAQNWLRFGCLKSCWTAVVIGLLVCFFSGNTQAQTASQRNYIIDLYQTYFERTPGQPQINEWLGWFQRGSSAEEIHASFISSEELFNRMNRNVDRWLSYVFQAVAGRRPNSQELNYWQSRYLALRQDRRAFGLEFLRTMGNRRPASGASTSPARNTLKSLGGQIYSQSRSLRSAIISEYSNNASVLRLQANSLVNAAAGIRSATSRDNPDFQRIQQSVYDARSAYLALRAGVRGQFGSLKVQLFLNQVRDTLQQLSDQIGTAGGGSVGRPPGYYPPGGIPGWPAPDRPGNGWEAPDWRSLDRLVQALSNEVSGLYFLLQTLSRNDYRYQALVGDMQWYYSQVNDFSTAINDNARRGRLRRMLRDLQSKSEEFNRRIAGQRVDVRLSQGLFQINQNLAQIETIIGRGDSGTAGNLPSYPQMPDYRQLLIEIDRAIAECDRLIAIYSSYVIYGRPVQVYLAELRAVRQQLRILRTAAVGSDKDLVRIEINAVANQIARLQPPRSQSGRLIIGANDANLNGLNSAASSIRAYAN